MAATTITDLADVEQLRLTEAILRDAYERARVNRQTAEAFAEDRVVEARTLTAGMRVLIGDHPHRIKSVVETDAGSIVVRTNATVRLFEPHALVVLP